MVDEKGINAGKFGKHTSPIMSWGVLKQPSVI